MVLDYKEVINIIQYDTRGGAEYWLREIGNMY